MPPPQYELEPMIDPFLNFFRQHTCYDLMPNSGKVVVLDADLPVKEAFHAAVENDLAFATLWDSKKQVMVGMLTVTDFIDILLHLHDRVNVIKELAEFPIRKWREMGRRPRPEKLVNISAEETLDQAVKVLRQHKIHRLPVVQDGALLHIVTHAPILTYATKNVPLDGPGMERSIEELGIGSYKDVIQVSKDTTLHSTLQALADHSISAVPVINEEGRVIDVYSRTDVMCLAQENEYNLQITVEQALRMRPKIPVYTCQKTDSFENVLRHLVRTRVHRLICVDADMKVEGIVSISDIFSFFYQFQPIES